MFFKNKLRYSNVGLFNLGTIYIYIYIVPKLRGSGQNGVLPLLQNTSVRSLLQKEYAYIRVSSLIVEKH